MPNKVNRECNSLGLTYSVSVPADYASFDEMAGRPNAALEEAIANVVYRGVNADFRAAFLDAAEEFLTATLGDEFKRKEFETGKTKKGKGENAADEPVIELEKEGVYMKRIVSQLVEAGELASDAKEVVQTYFQSIIDGVLAGTDEDGNPLVSFDPKQRERKVKSKRIPQYIYKTIDALWNLGEDAVRSAASKLARELGIEVDASSKDSLAKALYTRESSRDRDLERARALAE